MGRHDKEKKKIIHIKIKRNQGKVGRNVRYAGCRHRQAKGWGVEWDKKKVPLYSNFAQIKLKTIQ